MIENGSWGVRLGRMVSRFAIVLLIVLGVVSRSTVLAADERKHKGSDDREHSAWGDREHEGSGDREHEGSGHKVVLASDWSHKHLVYSAPKTVTHAFSLSKETRYVQQWVRRNAEQHERGTWRHQENLLNGDWSMFLGNAGTVGPDKYPAKFSFDVTTANCGTATNPDFVVYNTSLPPSAAAASASQTGTFTTPPTAGDIVTITAASGLVTTDLTADAVQNSGPFWQVSASLSTDAANLAAAIVRNGGTLGVTATSLGAVVTITSTNVGTADNGIGVSYTGSAAFAWTAGTLAGGANGASIVAFDNLYKVGCSGTVPSVYWAYNTGGTISTSITLSGDGSQVAFVQINQDGIGNTVGLAELVLLKWKASATDTVNAPTTLATNVTPALYRGCTAPCMTRIPFTTPTTDTNSSPFYDFTPGSDKLYVGDDAGELLQFTGVFRGTPAQSGAPYPVTLTVGATTTSPVFDQGTGKVYIADTVGLLYGVDVTTGTVTTSGQLATPIQGFTGAPVVDSSAGFVYLFTADNNATNCGAGGLPAVYQIPVGFVNGGVGSNVTLGTAGVSCSDAVPMYDGEFDNLYYSSASGNAGHLYVCGNPGGNPTLYQITITGAGALGAVNTGPELGTTNFPCSPLTEVFNTGTNKDWIFMSVQDFGVTTAPITCPATAGCIMSFDVTTGAILTPAKATTAAVSAPGGASGVVLDNTVAAGTLAGASQVYFSTLTNGTCATSTGTGGCAVQASQSALF
jgi:hypothetical protein